MGRLEGRSIIITGAGRGVGAACARLCAAEGAAVLVNDLGSAVDGTGEDRAPAQQVVDEIIAAGGTAVTNFGDVSDFKAAEQIVEHAVDEFGQLDVLVNVAGILRDRMIFNMSEEEWDAVVRVHLKGTFNTSKFASIYWRKERAGKYRLINFTSGSGLHGAPGQPNYAAAKLGIVGFTYSCARALAPYGVTANSVGPAASTRMTDTIPQQNLDAMGWEADKYSPAQVAPVVAWLASTLSEWCNGQVLHAGGGEISIYNIPQRIASISSDGPWDLGDVFTRVEQEFRSLVEAEPVRQP